MFYKNNDAILYTELEIVDKDFTPVKEKYYISAKKNIENTLAGKSHAIIDDKK